ncbi:hypothetical protein N9005_06380, partial [Akkermansiaceae bacterium]|nr:hypothetical protein [Akkermansiaceae bacterium]
MRCEDPEATIIAAKLIELRCDFSSDRLVLLAHLPNLVTRPSGKVLHYLLGEGLAVDAPGG